MPGTDLDLAFANKLAWSVARHYRRHPYPITLGDLHADALAAIWQSFGRYGDATSHRMWLWGKSGVLHRFKHERHHAAKRERARARIAAAVSSPSEFVAIALAKLDAPARELLERFYLRDEPQNALARELGRAETTLGYRRRRALVTLKEELCKLSSRFDALSSPSP